MLTFGLNWVEPWIDEISVKESKFKVNGYDYVDIDWLIEWFIDGFTQIVEEINQS